ncbi:MAG: hypothetical protein ABIT38_18560, partial [Gemmatimonadaceae bacterium]
QTIMTTERIPRVEVVAQNVAVHVKVVRPFVCAMIVDARIARSARTIDVVTRVAANPAADCLFVSPPPASTYAMKILNVSPGPLNVRVFEGFGDATPTLIDRVSVNVLP